MELTEEQKNCIYCHSNVMGGKELLRDSLASVFLDANGTLLLDTDDGDGDDLQFNYCPMCGRSLA